MSTVRLKAYQETHGDDDLLFAILKIINKAAKDGVKTLFIEQPPESQPLHDALGPQFLKAAPDIRLLIAGQMAAYAAEDSESAERITIREHFLSTMCALTKIRIVCADVSYRDPMLDIVKKYLDLVCDHPLKFRAMTPGEQARALRCPPDKVRTIISELDAAIADGSIVKKISDLKQSRLSQDPKVADFMLTQMTNGSAIAIYGGEHLDFDRPNSIASHLHDRMGPAFEVYDISADKLIKIRAPVRGALSSPLATDTLDAF